MLLSSLFLVAALHAQPTPVLLPQQTSADTAEGLEILRRILVDSLEKAFETDEPKDVHTTFGAPLGTGHFEGEGLISLLYAGQQTVEFSRVFHLPGAGVFFALDASLPMIEAKEEPQPAGDAPRDDEWERYRREVRGGGGGGELPGGVQVWRKRRMELDPTSIDKLIDTALLALARHTARVPGLEAEEKITLAVRLGGSLQSMWSTTAPLAAEAEGEPDVSVQGKSRQLFSYSLATTGDTPTRNLVLEIRVGDLQAGVNGPASELRRRARINRY